MELADLEFALCVAYDDLSDVWPAIELQSSIPLRDVPLTDKLGSTVVVKEVPIKILPSNHGSLRRLQDHAGSAVVWFRQPAVSLVCISCEDPEEFKRNFRLQLRAMIDPETRHPLAPEPVFVYVRPSGLDNDAKGPAKVLEAMRRELGSRRRERVAQFNPYSYERPSNRIDEVVSCLKEALRASLEARVAAYSEEMRRQLGAAVGPHAGAFPDLFLLKDSLAVMMEAAGLLQDALREYMELDVAYLQATADRNAGHNDIDKQKIGAPGSLASEEVDEAAPMWAAWGSARRSIQETRGLYYTHSQLAVRQALFANEARVLLKMQGHAEVLQRGLALIDQAGAGLETASREETAPLLLRESWSFASCASLATAVATLQAQLQAAPGSELSRENNNHTAETTISPAGLNSFLKGIGLGSSSHGASLAGDQEEGPFAAAAGGVPLSGDVYDPATWKLGCLPSVSGPGRLPGMNSTGPLTAERQAAQRVYCLLGQLYCLAREHLETLGTASGLHSPVFNPSLEATAKRAVSSPAKAPAAVSSPRRSLARSLSPSRSMEATFTRSLMSGHTGMDDSGDEASSPLTLREKYGLLNKRENFKEGYTSQGDVEMEQMQTIDLSAQAAAAAAAAVGGISRQATTATDDGEGEGAATATETQFTQEEDQQQVEMESLPSAGLSTQSSRSLAPSSAPLGGAREDYPRRGGGIGGQVSSRASNISIHTRKYSEAGSTASTPRSTTPAAAAPGEIEPAASPVPPPLVAPTTVGATQGSPESFSLSHVESLVAGLGGDGTPYEASVHHMRRTSTHDSSSRPSSSIGGDINGPSVWTPVHWRLRAALSSQSAYSGLWTALSSAAAACFEEGGHIRHALLSRADVADSLASRGLVAEAAEVYESQCRTALREGWLAAARKTLPKLAACQLEDEHPGLPHTAAALLFLLAKEGTAQEVAAAMELFQGASRAPSPVLSSLPSLVGSSGLYGSIDISSVLAAAPVRGLYCKFYGRSGTDGRPVLAPTCIKDGPVGAVRQKIQATVGDIAPIVLQVINPLPTMIELSDLRLVLTGMQEMSALASPRAVSPAAFRVAMQTLPLTTRTSFGTVPSSTPLSAAFPTPFGSSRGGGDGAIGIGAGGGGQLTPLSAGARLHSFADEGEEARYVPEWQDIEELQCPLESISYDAPPQSSQKPDAMKATPMTGPIELRPGGNYLVFHAAPVKRGLYKPQRVTGMLGQLSISLDVVPSPRFLKSLEFTVASSGVQQVSGADSSVPEVPVVLEVEAPRPRVTVAAVAAGGACLIAGQHQWLGLHMAPGQDTLQNSSLTVTWPLPPSFADIARKVTGLLGLPSPSPGMGNQVSLAATGAAAAAVAATAAADPKLPVLLPQQAAAVLSGTGSTLGSTGVVVRAARGSAPAAWAEEGTEEIEIPSECGGNGGPVTAWWWVDVGPYSCPVEHVHVAPPGVGGVGGALLDGLAVNELNAPSPAVLDLPVAVQYFSGCRRTYTKVLPVPVQQPFSVRTSAQELHNGVVVVNFMLSSHLPYPVQITDASVAPQPGLLLHSSAAQQLGLLPLHLPAHGHVALSFQLDLDASIVCGDRASAQAKLQQAAKLQPSALIVTYTIDEDDACGAPVAGAPSKEEGTGAGHRGGAGAGNRASLTARGVAATALADAAAAAAAAAARGVQLPTSIELRQLRATARPSSAATGGISPPSHGADRETTQVCTFSHACALELPSLDVELPSAVVLLQHLGPFTATAGQPLSMYWRLERAGLSEDSAAAAAAGEPSRLHFEIVAEGDSWRPMGRRSGAVILDAHDGALATVEATLVPLSGGSLPVPSLRLKDVSYQEVFDVGTGGTNYVMVSPPIL